jgi:VWFA-related protein
MRVRTFFLPALLACLLGAAVLTARQQQPPSGQGAPQMPPVTFKVEVNYVEVDASVLDERGEFVRDLRKEDFQVFEDGQLQDVSVFSLVDIPLEKAEVPLFAARPIEPDVRSNADYAEGRLYVIVLDDLHTHFTRSVRVKAAARDFIERNLRANDIAAVVATSGRNDLAQDFTSNHRLLIEATDRFMGRRMRSATLERLDARQTGGSVLGSEFERSYQARSALTTLRQLSDFLAGVRGRRKAVVLISEGIDYDVSGLASGSGGEGGEAGGAAGGEGGEGQNPATVTQTLSSDGHMIIREMQEVISAASRANVSIYALDPRGLTTMGEELIEVQGVSPTSTESAISQLWDELRWAQDSLRVLADQTGGFAAVNSNDLTTAFERIVSENSSYYVLGYYPTNDRRDGRFRRIEVRTSKPGVQVRARRGYVAPRGKAPSPPAVTASSTSPQLREALDSPLPVAGLPLSVFAAPFKGTSNASVVLSVQVPGKNLRFEERDGAFHSTLEVSSIAIDDRGKVRTGDRRSVELALRQETHKRVVESGIRVHSKLDLPAGRYILRVGARESNGGGVGSVHYDLEVPDFRKSQLVMSGLLFTSTKAGIVPTADDGGFRDVLPGPITTARDFGADEELSVFTEVYDNIRRPAHSVEITTTVQPEGGRTVFRHQEQRSSSELGSTGGGYGYLARIPLSEMAAGLYVLTIEARTSLGDGSPVKREVQFRVR